MSDDRRITLLGATAIVGLGTTSIYFGVGYFKSRKLAS